MFIKYSILQLLLEQKIKENTRVSGFRTSWYWTNYDTDVMKNLSVWA